MNLLSRAGLSVLSILLMASAYAEPNKLFVDDENLDEDAVLKELSAKDSGRIRELRSDRKRYRLTRIDQTVVPQKAGDQLTLNLLEDKQFTLIIEEVKRFDGSTTFLFRGLIGNIGPGIEEMKLQISKADWGLPPDDAIHLLAGFKLFATLYDRNEDTGEVRPASDRPDPLTDSLIPNQVAGGQHWEHFSSFYGVRGTIADRSTGMKYFIAPLESNPSYVLIREFVNRPDQ